MAGARRLHGHRNSLCKVLGMRQAQSPLRDAPVRRQSIRLARQAQNGGPGSVVDNLDVTKGEGPQANAKRLHDGFLRREAHGKSLGWVTSPQCIGPFAVGEQPFHQPWRTGQSHTKSVDLDEIDTDADHRLRHRSASTRTGSTNNSIIGTSASNSSRKNDSVSVTASTSAEYRPR